MCCVPQITMRHSNSNASRRAHSRWEAVAFFCSALGLQVKFSHFPHLQSTVWFPLLPCWPQLCRGKRRWNTLGECGGFSWRSCIAAVNSATAEDESLSRYFVQSRGQRRLNREGLHTSLTIQWSQGKRAPAYNQQGRCLKVQWGTNLEFNGKYTSY